MAIFGTPPAIELPEAVPGIGPDTPVINENLKNTIKILNASWGVATNAINGFDTLVDKAVSAVDAESQVASVNLVDTNSVAPTAITLPTSTTYNSEILDKFDQKSKEYIDLLATKFADFQATYFSSTPSGNSWISGAMGNPNYAIPDSAADQIITGVRSRAYVDAAIQSDTVMATFAARRFPLPPGAAASAVMQLNQKAQDSISETGVALASKYVENMQFAVSQANKHRESVMHAAIGYINALVSGPNVGGVVGLGYDSQTRVYDAQSKLISAWTGYWNAGIEADKAKKQAEQFNSKMEFDFLVKNDEFNIHKIEEKVKLLMTEAQALAQVATSLFNNLHVSASISTTASGT